MMNEHEREAIYKTVANALREARGSILSGLSSERYRVQQHEQAVFCVAQAIAKEEPLFDALAFERHANGDPMRDVLRLMKEPEPEIAIVYVNGRRFKLPYVVTGKYGSWIARCTVLDMQRHSRTKEEAVANLRSAAQTYLQASVTRQPPLNPLEPMNLDR